MNSRSSLRLVQRALSIKHQNDLVYTEVTCGYNYNAPRIDLLVLERTSTQTPLITAYEIKTSHSDFIQDTKWGNYLEHCNSFYFACPKGIIQPDEITNPAGLVWAFNKGTRCKKKAVYRPMDPSWEVLYRILISHYKEDYSVLEKQEQRALLYQEWVDGKKQLNLLGYEVKDKLSTWMKDLLAREDYVKEAMSDVAHTKTLKVILEKGGIWLGRYNWESEVQKLVDQSKMIQSVRNMRLSVKTMKTNIKKLTDAINQISMEEEDDQPTDSE